MEQTPETVQKDAENEDEYEDQDQKQNQEEDQDEDQEREFLGKLIKRGVLELKPTINKVGIRYVEAEKTWKGVDSVKVKGILENLERGGFIESKCIDRVLTCPECGSPEMYSKYACSKCNSVDVEYTELLEHTKCGYMGSKSNFAKGSSLVCPRCKTELADDAVQCRVIGSCYQCEKCGYRFDTPMVIHFCQQCKRSSTHREAKYIKVYVYRISDETIKKFRREGEPARILVIDDDKGLRKALTTVLAEEGYVVDVAENGREATEKFSAKFYNLALVDRQLPDMDGTELLTVMKERTPKMIKIVITGHPSQQSAIDALDKDADAYMLKPLDMNDLLRRIKECLKKQEQAK